MLLCDRLYNANEHFRTAATGAITPVARSHPREQRCWVLMVVTPLLSCSGAADSSRARSMGALRLLAPNAIVADGGADLPVNCAGIHDFVRLDQRREPACAGDRSASADPPARPFGHNGSDLLSLQSRQPQDRSRLIRKKHVSVRPPPPAAAAGSPLLVRLNPPNRLGRSGDGHCQFIAGT